MNRFMWFLLFLVILVLVIDMYSFKGVMLLVRHLEKNLYRIGIISIYWLLTVFFLTSVFIMFLNRDQVRDPEKYFRYYIIFGVFLLIYLPKIFFLIFHLMDDILHLIRIAFSKLKPVILPVENNEGEPISRYRFLTQLGLIIASIPFAGVLYGIVKGRFDFRIEKVDLSFEHLPKEFDGMKIVQLSDIHIGSFIGQETKVKRAIEMVNKQHPDFIFFTGDLVNNFAEELDGWTDILGELKAKQGKFSILGNHDYGDYYEWENEQEKIKNLERIKESHSKMGFRLLLNESVQIRKNGEYFDIAGVENWGLPPFHQYGDLDKALSGTNANGFKILLSHDPSHWDAEVLKKADIDLTLSGHTHGMQFGIRIGNFEWSPVKIKYPRWGGLYMEGRNYLYVNRGFGYIGFPGRVGMPPEITVLNIKKAVV